MNLVSYENVLEGLKLKDNIIPHFLKSRSLSFALKEQAKSELTSLIIKGRLIAID